MNRVYRDVWIWVFLTLTSSCLAAGLWGNWITAKSLREVKSLRAELRWMQDEAEARKAENVQSKADRAHLNGEIGQIKGSQQWLEGVVKKAIDDDRKRREARSKGQ